MKKNSRINQRQSTRMRPSVRIVAVCGVVSMLAIVLGMFIYFSVSNVHYTRASGGPASGKNNSVPGLVPEQVLLTDFDVKIPQMRFKDEHPEVQHYRIAKQIPGR